MPSYWWQVLPGDTTRPIAALGVTDDSDTARKHVEQTMTDRDDALMGLLVSIGRVMERCRRGRAAGSLVWSPLASDDDSESPES
jgi:hypothetical protein